MRNPGGSSRQRRQWEKALKKFVGTQPDVRENVTPMVSADDKMPSVIIWLRGTGLGCALLGCIGMMQPSMFWLAVSLFYLGLMVLALDLFYEPRLSVPTKSFLVSIIVLVGGAAGFRFVFVSAPLDMAASATVALFPDGRIIEGIHWKPYYTELTVTVTNPTSDTYEDVTLFVKPDYPVAAVAQRTKIAGVSIQERFAHDMRVAVDNSVVDLVRIATESGYSIHIASIPSNGSVTVVFALVNFKKGMRNEVDPSKPDNVDPRLPSAVFRLRSTITNGIVSWWTHAENESLYAERPLPKVVNVSGRYVGELRYRYVDSALNVVTPGR